MAPAAEVRLVEQDGEVMPGGDVEREAALDDAAAGDARRGGVVHLPGVAVERDGVAADDQGALGLGVDLAVGTVEGGHQEQSALEAGRVAG
jgi:hypothetical protein